MYSLNSFLQATMYNFNLYWQAAIYSLNVFLKASICSLNVFLKAAIYSLKVFLKLVSEYDQEIPQSQTADNPVAPRGRAAQPSRDTRKTN